MNRLTGQNAGVSGPPPYLFGITNLPFGVANAYAAVAMPFILRKAGVPVETIATLGAIALIPSAYQLFWAPVLDLKIRRRTWLVLCAGLGALCLGASMLLKLPEQLVPFEVLLVLGAGLVSLVGSCNGALISTTLDPSQRGRAAGWFNAAFMGATALGGGALLTTCHHFGAVVGSVVLTAMIFLPSLAALTIEEPAPAKTPLFQHLRRMMREVWSALSSKQGLSGVLLCLSPVGTVALTYLWSALGADFGGSERAVQLVNGYVGGLITAVACLVTGYALDRINPRVAYLAGGALTAVCCIVMALAPQSEVTFIVGASCYLLVAGLCYAAFSALIYQISGSAKEGASSLYTIFSAAGNQAIAYTLFLDGKAHAVWNTNGLLWCDAALNACGVVVLLLLLFTVFRTKRPTGQTRV